MIREKNGNWKLSDDEMNFVAIVARETARWYERRKLKGLGGAAKDMADTITRTLRSVGYYDK